MMNLYELLIALNVLVYVFTLGRKRNWAFIAGACLLGPAIWFFEAYLHRIEPMLDRRRDTTIPRYIAVFISLILGAVTILATYKLTNHIQLW